jgi:C4-dicarboxylate-binding protein DctP
VVLRENITAEGRKGSDLLALTETGELDGCYFSSSYLAKRVPELALFDQHFAVPSRADAYRVLDGSLGERLKEFVEANTGYTVLGYWDNGLRHVSSRTGPVNTLEKCKGLKLRTLASEDHHRVFRALGFEPKTIDVRDLPAAVSSGEVDAQENPLTNIYNFDLHKTHRSITLTGHLLGVALVLFNREKFESWPLEVQVAVRKAVTEATKLQRRFAEDDDVICAKAMQEEGVELIELTDAERTVFADAARAEVEATRQRFSPELIALFENDIANKG